MNMNTTKEGKLGGYMCEYEYDRIHSPRSLHVSSAVPGHWLDPFRSHQTEQSPSPVGVREYTFSDLYVCACELRLERQTRQQT